MTTKPFIIAIDGPSASGKGTIARKLAEHFHYAHLDTGLLYRAVGLSVLDRGGDPTDEKTAIDAALTLNPLVIENRQVDLRSDRVSTAASKVAAIPNVRAALLATSKRLLRTPSRR